MRLPLLVPPGICWNQRTGGAFEKARKRAGPSGVSPLGPVSSHAEVWFLAYGPGLRSGSSCCFLCAAQLADFR
jgi:hypothetical protein